jgi:alkyldihydroxyacetonephosphate synthase
MRRWNGWGDDTKTYEVPESAIPRLTAWVGPGLHPEDASLQAVAALVPPSRLPDHPLVNTEPTVRVRHARGQSLPDWIALRSGQIDIFPDGVAFPTDDDEVRSLLGYAKEIGALVIPNGGGTSVVGHINPLAGDRPVLTLVLGRLNRLRSFDETSLLATFGAGIAGPDLEAQLRARGCTLGHFPQSFELSTLGGWVVTRSSGQQSLGYGRIEDLFVGGRLESPAGALILPASYPASAAGPDLRQLVLGSEGRLGILTEATVRASRLPEMEEFHAVFFPDFDAAREAARGMIQAGIPLSMLRVSTARETETTLALAGHDLLIAALQHLLALRGVENERALLLFAVTGRARLGRASRRDAVEIAAEHSGVHVGRTFGNQWEHSRFRTPYLRNTLWKMGYAVDTLETAMNWSATSTMITAIEEALRTALAAEGEPVHAFTHLSHFYRDGCSVYTTFLFRRALEPETTLQRWHALKTAASVAIMNHGGTITHQHGVGTDHAPYMVAEKGKLGIAALEAAIGVFDPTKMMNPGKLLP